MNNSEEWNDKYILLEPLGDIGIASFALVENGGNKFIVKFLQQLNHEDDRLAQKMFWNEISLLLRVENDSHKGFVRHADHFGNERNNLVFHHEPLERSLAKISSDKNKFSVWQCMLAGMEICEILEYLHFRQIMHGNVSPHSFLQIYGRVMCLDLFHSRSWTESREPDKWLTEYAAPEQHEGIVDPYCDLYGLGLTMIALASGKDPSIVHTGKRLTFTTHEKFDDLLNQLIQTDPTMRPSNARRVRLSLYDLYREFEPDFRPISPEIAKRLKPFEHRLKDSALKEIGGLTDFEATRLLADFETLTPTEVLTRQKWLNLTEDEARQLDGIKQAQEALRNFEYPALFEILLDFAVSDCAWAQNNLGVLFEVGLGTEQSYEEALKWYGRAAVERGNATAHENTALMYMEGRGIPVDEAKALELLAKGAALQNSFKDHNSFKIGTTYDWTWDPAFPISGPKERKSNVNR